MRDVFGTLALSLCAAVAVAQESPTWRLHELPDATTTAFALLWEHGFDDDVDLVHGAARVLVECRLERARAAVPQVTTSGFVVGPDASLVFVLVDAKDHASGLRFCEAAANDAASLSDDTIALVIARAALAADDAEWLHPGPVLQCRARAALCTGPAARPVAGSPRALQSLSPARVRELSKSGAPPRGLALGAIAAELRAAAANWPACRRTPTARSFGGVTTTTTVTNAPLVHPRLDGPLVATAFVVPDSVPLAAFAVAIEVAKARAARRLRLQGRELLARAPIVEWSWLRGDPLVVFCRRGANGAEPSRAAAELDALLADLRTNAPSADELAAAIQGVIGETLGGPGRAAAAATLPGRATAMLLAEWRGIVANDISVVTADAARAAFARGCPETAGFRGTLVPAPADEPGWRAWR